ncbi:hypothetical protein [Natrarchaeobius chitinivorans]|nr:hypothetical protein [Natrarchaeobius chitinivorans]
MQTPLFHGKSVEWYSSVMTGYIVTASAVSIGLTALMATGVV